MIIYFYFNNKIFNNFEEFYKIFNSINQYHFLSNISVNFLKSPW